MIIIRLRGGLGNQMFQYAFGKSVATKRSEKMVLDTTWYRRADRTFLLNTFNVAYSGLIKSRVVARPLRLVLRNRTLSDTGYHGISDSAYSGKYFFDGFWENYKHFEAIVPLLQREFTLKKPRAAFLAYAEELARTDTISIHVRRGDFKTFPGRRLLPKSYYESAVRKVLDLTGLTNPKFLIFSDDKAWCRQELKLIHGHVTTVVEDSRLSENEELILMSLCKHNIIANSTFSWWAAFLNQNPGHIIVAPRFWGPNTEVPALAGDGLILPTWHTV